MTPARRGEGLDVCRASGARSGRSRGRGGGKARQDVEAVHGELVMPYEGEAKGASDYRVCVGREKAVDGYEYPKAGAEGRCAG